MKYYYSELEQAEINVLSFLFFSQKKTPLESLILESDFKNDNHRFICKNIHNNVLFWAFKSKKQTKEILAAVYSFNMNKTLSEALAAYQFMIEYKVAYALVTKLEMLPIGDSLIYNQKKADAIEYLNEAHDIPLWTKAEIVMSDLLGDFLFESIHDFINDLRQNVAEKMTAIKSHFNQHKELEAFIKLEINHTNKNCMELRNVQNIFKVLYYDSSTPDNFKTIVATLVELLANGCLKHKQKELLQLLKEINK